MTSILRNGARVLVIAAAPLPFLYAGAVVQRQDLWWVLLGDLCILAIAAWWRPDARSDAAEGIGGWRFQRKNVSE